MSLGREVRPAQREQYARQQPPSATQNATVVLSLEGTLFLFEIISRPTGDGLHQNVMLRNAASVNSLTYERTRSAYARRHTLTYGTMGTLITSSSVTDTAAKPGGIIVVIRCLGTSG